jgi:hypothetical protein
MTSGVVHLCQIPVDVLEGSFDEIHGILEVGQERRRDKDVV